jgi:hypothetical protein
MLYGSIILKSRQLLFDIGKSSAAQYIKYMPHSINPSLKPANDTINALKIGVPNVCG